MFNSQRKIEIGISTYGERIAAALLLSKKLIQVFDVFIVHQEFFELQDTDKKNLEELLDSGRFRYYTLPGKGVARSRNRAIQASQKEYLWFMDDDVDINFSNSEALLALLDKKKPDILTVGVLDEAGNSRRKFPCRNTKRNRLSILSVGSIEVIINSQKVKSKGCWFPEDMGAGTDLPIADEPVFLSKCLDAGLKISFHPFFMVSHPQESSGSDFLDKQKCYARGIAFQRIYGQFFGVILVLAMYLKKGFKNDYPVSSLIAGCWLSLSALLHKN